MKQNHLKDRYKNYLKFSSMALQMGIFITAGALGGNYLDKNQNNHFHIWTLCLTLFAVFGALLKFIIDVKKMGDNDDTDSSD